MADLRAALVAIQELHKPSCVGSKAIARGVTAYCAECGKIAPCPTRRLADDALTGRTTKNGDNK